MEFIPMRPLAHEIGIGEKYARGIGVRAKDADRFARLHQQGFVIFERLQRAHQRIKGRPVARSLSCAAINDQLIWALGDFWVEIVHQHSERGFLHPAFAAEFAASGRFYNSFCFHC